MQSKTGCVTRVGSVIIAYSSLAGSIDSSGGTSTCFCFLAGGFERDFWGDERAGRFVARGELREGSFPLGMLELRVGTSCTITTAMVKTNVNGVSVCGKVPLFLRSNLR
jgi:hypothetical protein